MRKKSGALPFLMAVIFSALATSWGGGVLAETVNLEIPPLVNGDHVNAGWEVIDNIASSHTNTKWHSESIGGKSALQTKYNNSNDAGKDDWLITQNKYPLQTGINYNISLEVYFNESYPGDTERILVMISNAGRAYTDFSKEKPIISKKVKTGDSEAMKWITVTETFTVETSGEYYFAICADTPDNNGGNYGDLAVHSLTVTYDSTQKPSDSGNTGDTGDTGGSEDSGEPKQPETPSNPGEGIEMLEPKVMSSSHLEGWSASNPGYTEQDDDVNVGWVISPGVSAVCYTYTHGGGHAWLTSQPATLKAQTEYTVMFEYIPSPFSTEDIDNLYLYILSGEGENERQAIFEKEIKTGDYKDKQAEPIKVVVSFKLDNPGDYSFAFMCPLCETGNGLYLQNLVIAPSQGAADIKQVTLSPAIDVESDGKHGYIVKSNGSHEHQALKDEEATHYDISAVTADGGEELNMFEVANTNALVIFSHEASHMKTNANRVSKQADGSLRAESLKIEAEKPFHFGKDVDADRVDFTRQKGTEPRRYVTLVLPFEFNNNGEGVSVLRGLNDAEDMLQFVSLTDATVPAYTPFLYNANAADIAFTGKNLKASKNQDDVVIVDMENSDWKAAYVTEETSISVDDEQFAGYEVYYISGDVFWHATGSLTLHPFRTFFLCPKSSAPARVSAKLNFFIDGDVPTGLEDMYLEQGIESKAPAYGLNGLRVGDDYQGVTIQNGKKTIRVKD